MQMAAYRRLCQPLWAWSCKYQRRAYCLKLHDKKSQADEQSAYSKNRKVVSLRKIIETHPDLYDRIINKKLSSTGWQNIRENLLKNQQSSGSQLVTTATIDSIIIDMCLTEFRVDKAMEYYKFLKEHNYPLNVAIIGKYLRLFVLKHDSLTDLDKREIVAICDALLEKYPCLDSITAEHCITSLCLTDQWEKSIKIIDMIKLTTKPGTVVYSAIASAAFQHDKPDIGWDAMQQTISRGLRLQNAVYTSYLRYCEHGGRRLFDDRLEEMFVFWADNGEKPYNHVLNAYAEVAGEHGWSAAPTHISKGGQCKNCSHSLSDLKFNEETFQELVDAFMKRVIIGSDIYFKSHPHELRKFTEFVKKTGPYDVVIDGLNITYIMKKFANSNSLIKVVEYFVKQNQKVLVLTRKHQKKLPALEYIQRHAYVFWTGNLSMDDPYLLYATLVSGKNAMFVSMDLMRQHKFLLEDKRLQWVFKKWQCSHQYFVKPIGSYAKIIPPYSFMPHSQKNSDSWHVPYISDDSTNPDTFEFPDKWYCFYKKRRKSK